MSTQAYYLKNRETILRKQASYRELNAERLKLAKKARYEANKAVILSKNAEYSKCNRAKRLDYWKTYHRLNKKRWPAKPKTHEQKLKKAAYQKKHAKKLRAYWRAYRKSHPEQTKAHNKSNWHKRRALLAGATVNLTQIKQFIFAVRSRKQFTCYYCRQSLALRFLHFDHIVPLAKGGSHSVDNLCTSCSECNQSKHNKLVTAWVRVGQQVLSL